MIFGLEFYVEEHGLAVGIGNACGHIGVFARAIDTLGVVKQRGSRPSRISEMKISRVIVAVIAELSMQRIVGDRDARCQVKILKKITDRPSAANIVVDLDNKTVANVGGQSAEDGQETLGNFYGVAVLTTMDVERRAVILRQADKIENLCVLGQIIDAVADSGRVEAGEGDVLGGMSRNTDAGTNDGSGDLVERSADVGPVGQVLQPQVDDGVRDDGDERRGEAIACDARVGAVLDGAIGNKEVVEDALADGLDCLGARQLEKARQGHSLELMTLVSKNVGDAAKCELHKAMEANADGLVNSEAALFSN